MSRRTWGITLTVLALAIVAAAALWYVRRDTAIPPEEQRGTELVEMLPAETRPDRVTQPEDTKDAPSAEEPEDTEAEGYAYVLRNHASRR